MKKLLLAVLVLAFFVSSVPSADALTLNVTSDIHAGKQKKRDYSKYTAGNVVYPKKAEKYFKNWLKNSGDVFLALGDNSNTCKDAKKYDRKLRKAVEKSKKAVYFGFGNHDCDKGFYYLSGSKYYTIDKDGWRIIVMNSEENGESKDGYGLGGFSDKQMEWLKEQVKTDKKVVIAASKPAFEKDLKTPKTTYKELFKVIEDNENIKHVVGGDYHVFHQTKEFDEYKGVKFHFVQALTLKGSEGRFLRLDLDQP